MHSRDLPFNDMPTLPAASVAQRVHVKNDGRFLTRSSHLFVSTTCSPQEADWREETVNKHCSSDQSPMDKYLSP